MTSGCSTSGFSSCSLCDWNTKKSTHSKRVVWAVSDLFFVTFVILFRISVLCAVSENNVWNYISHLSWLQHVMTSLCSEAMQSSKSDWEQGERCVPVGAMSFPLSQDMNRSLWKKNRSRDGLKKRERERSSLYFLSLFFPVVCRLCSEWAEKGR